MHNVCWVTILHTFHGCTCEIRVFWRVVGKEVEDEHEEAEGEQQAAQDIEIRGILGHAASDHVASHTKHQGRIQNYTPPP